MTSAQKLRSTFRPPKSVSSNLGRGRSLKERWGRGGSGAFAVCATKGAVAGSADGLTLTWDEIVKMHSYLTSHPSSFNPNHRESDGGPDTATIDWLLHGGTAGLSWAEKILSQGEEAPVKKFNHDNKILKVDENLGLVLGYAIISKQDGEDYYDLQGDHIPEDAMLKAAVDFMQGARVVGDMHREDEGGTVVFAWPMTSEIAKAFGIETTTTGLMIGIKPKNQKTLEKFRSGEYNGFSIGGIRIEDEEVEDE